MTWSPEDDERDDRALADELFAPLDGRAGPARRLSPVVSAEIVRSVLETALDAPEDPGADLPPPVRQPSPWPYRLLVAAAAGAALTVATGASAVAWRLLHVELGDPEPAPAVPAPQVDRRPAAPADPEAEPQEIVIPRSVVEPQPERMVERARKKRLQKVAAARPRRSAPAPLPAPVPSAPEPAHAASQKVVVPNLPPADLLALANERRQRREWDAADVYYEAVVSRFPGTDAAVVAEVATAGLHLNHLGDPAGALQGYRRTLSDRPLGPLAEEARWGIVEAQRSLGDKHAEAAALREFLRSHPDSALAPAARRRLARLAP